MFDRVLTNLHRTVTCHGYLYLITVSFTMTRDTPHIAVLVLEPPNAELSPLFGDFGDASRELLVQGGTCQYPAVKYQAHYKDEGYREELVAMYEGLKRNIGAGTVKGVFLTGSNADAFATGVLWIDLLNEFITQFLFKLENFPIVGICFGHQILAQALGSKVARNLPEVGREYGTSTIKLNDDIFAIKDTPFDVLHDDNGNVILHLNLSEFHQDIVYDLPPPAKDMSVKFESIGCTDKCAIQGLITETGPIKLLTFQGHPEFTKEFSLALLEYEFKNDHFLPLEYEKYKYHTEILNNQGNLVGKVIGKFFNTYNG